MTVQKISTPALSFASLCAATDRKLETELASASRDQIAFTFAAGARECGGDAANVEGKIATLAIMASYLVDVDDAGKVNAEQREAVRVDFQREQSIGWLMAGNPRLNRPGMAEDKAREELANMTELAKKARAHAQTYWKRVSEKAEIRDPETDEQRAKREAAAAKKAATNAAKKAEKAGADASEASAQADKAQTALTQTIAPTADKPVSDAPQAATIDATPQAVLEALLRLSPDAMLATLTQAAMLRRKVGDASKASDHALAAIVLTGGEWRKARDAEVESAKVTPAQAALDAAQAEVAALRAQLAKVAHGPAEPAKVAPKPRTARGK